MVDFTLIIPAAGSGSRSGQEIPKQYVEILGRAVLEHTLRAFAAMEECVEIIVAIDERWREMAMRCARGIERVQFVGGGMERQHSIANALSASESSAPIVLVHDAARPLVSAALIERVVGAAVQFGAAIPALPILETVKRVDESGIILETIPRGTLRAAQTPQGFQRDLLTAAYAHAADHAIAVTDDASLVEAYGAKVRVIEGAWENIKITVPDDFRRAEEHLRTQSH